MNDCKSFLVLPNWFVTIAATLNCWLTLFELKSVLSIFILGSHTPRIINYKLYNEKDFS